MCDWSLNSYWNWDRNQRKTSFCFDLRHNSPNENINSSARFQHLLTINRTTSKHAMKNDFFLPCASNNFIDNFCVLPRVNSCQWPNEISVVVVVAAEVTQRIFWMRKSFVKVTRIRSQSINFSFSPCRAKTS